MSLPEGLRGQRGTLTVNEAAGQSKGERRPREEGWGPEPEPWARGRSRDLSSSGLLFSGSLSPLGPS